MKEPEVSVIVTAYNVELYLEACVRSILRQTMPDFEMILVEDCSTDGTRAEAERLALMDERIRLVCHEQNFGVSAGRNKGFRLRAEGTSCSSTAMTGWKIRVWHLFCGWRMNRERIS